MNLESPEIRNKVRKILSKYVDGIDISEEAEYEIAKVLAEHINIDPEDIGVEVIADWDASYGTSARNIVVRIKRYGENKTYFMEFKMMLDVTIV